MALNKLKSLISNNLNVIKDENKNSSEKKDTSVQEKLKITYEEWGFESAGKSNGLEMPFKGWLNLVREYFRKESLENQKETEKVVNDAKTDLQKREIQIQQKEDEIKRIEETKISPLKQKIELLKKEMIRIKENPQEILKDKVGKVGFIIGTLILIALSIYLFIFYSSASFSAFFKEFKPDDVGMAGSIFDPKAIEVAYEDGITEAILILTIPFMFIGLGFLIHKFQEKKELKSYLKVIGLIVVTFIFDFILAYEITQKIYEIKKEGSLGENFPDYTVALAFQSVNFWLIIFAGFVVYLVWGFIFDFVMESYDKLDIVKQALKARETEIKLYETDINKFRKEIGSLNNEITKLKLEIADLEKVINGNTIIVNWEGYRKSIFEFVSGWGHWMSANKKLKFDIDKIHVIADDFVNKEWSKYNTEKK